MKRNINEVVFNGRGSNSSRALDEFIEWLGGLRESIPAEHRASAMVDIDSEDDGYGANWAELTVSYTRPETDEEEAKREAQEHARVEAQRQQELRTLAALRAKYEGTP